MSTADEIEEIAARFLMRQGEPDWSPAAQAELDSWLAQSMAHKAAFWRLQHGWHAAGRLRVLNGQMPKRRPAWEVTGWRPALLAASLMLAVLTGGAYWLDLFGTAPVAYETAIGEHSIVPLPDGSRVELNTSTAIRTDVDGRSRAVWVENGEIYLEVAHDATRPFVVHAGDRTVTVLGTRFVVRREADRLTVSVIDGTVRLDSEADGAAGGVGQAVMRRGDIAIAEGNATRVTQGALAEVERSLRWRDGMFSFEQSSLAAVAAEFNRYSRRKLVVADPEIAGMLIGGSFQTTNIDAFVSLLQSAYGLHVEAEAERIRISR